MKPISKSYDKQIDDQDHELTYWSEKLGVSRDQLREAIAKVGSMRKAVELTGQLIIRSACRRIAEMIRPSRSPRRGPPPSV